jgi:hypothetical protein
MKAQPPKPTGSLRLSEFASSGRVVRVRSEVVGAEVYFAADNADTTTVPPEAVIFWPDELADIHDAGPEFLKLLWAAKCAFDPHGRTEAEAEV